MGILCGKTVRLDGSDSRARINFTTCIVGERADTHTSKIWFELFAYGSNVAGLCVFDNVNRIQIFIRFDAEI